MREIGAKGGRTRVANQTPDQRTLSARYAVLTRYARRMREQGMSWRQIAHKLGVPESTARERGLSVKKKERSRAA